MFNDFGRIKSEEPIKDFNYKPINSHEIPGKRYVADVFLQTRFL